MNFTTNSCFVLLVLFCGFRLFNESCATLLLYWHWDKHRVALVTIMYKIWFAVSIAFSWHQSYYMAFDWLKVGLPANQNSCQEMIIHQLWYLKLHHTSNGYTWTEPVKNNTWTIHRSVMMGCTNDNVLSIIQNIIRWLYIWKYVQLHYSLCCSWKSTWLFVSESSGKWMSIVVFSYSRIECHFNWWIPGLCSEASILLEMWKLPEVIK